MSKSRTQRYLDRKFNKLILLKVLQLTKEDFCSECEEKIDEDEAFCLHHVEPWRKEDYQKVQEIFYDLNNIKFVHSFCHSPDSKTGNGISRHFGICKISYKWGERWEARIPNPNGKQFIYCGQSLTEDGAAQIRDMAMLKNYRLKGRLNFPELKPLYLEKIRNEQK